MPISSIHGKDTILSWLKEKKDINVDEILLNQKIQFMTLDNKNGFAKIVKESVKKA